MATTIDQSAEATPLPPKRTGLLPRVSQEFVQAAFQSKPRGRIGTDDMLAIRDALSKLLASSGGRPGIAGADDRVKIPRIEEDWLILEKMSEAAGNLRHKPSPGQTAAIVLHLALQKFDIAEFEAEIKKVFDV